MTRVAFPACTRRPGAALLVALAAAAPRALAQTTPPPLDNVVFVHGLAADEHSWENTANRLAREFYFMPYRVRLPWTQTEAIQAAVLAKYTTAVPAPFAIVSKSNGVLASRTFVQGSTRANRHLGVGGPNIGAPLAANTLSGAVFQFPGIALADLADAARWYATYETRVDPTLDEAIYLMGDIFGLFSHTFEILGNAGFFYYTVAQQYVPVAFELVPGSATLTAMNSAAALQREAANAPIRVGLQGVFGYPRDLFFYTLTPGVARTASSLRWFTFVLSTALFEYYANEIDPLVPNYWQLHGGAFRWANVAADMLDIDPWWLDNIGVLAGYNGAVVSYRESDGIVPLASAVYPGAGFQYQAGPTSHMVMNEDINVVGRLREVFRSRFAIAARATPVNAVTVTPASFTLTAGASRQLTATAYDAVGTPVTGRPVTWSSSNTAIATVGAGGYVHAVAAGVATITATVDGYRGAATVTVTSPTLPPPPDDCVPTSTTPCKL